MFCQNCGQELPEGTAVCNRCGHATFTAPPVPYQREESNGIAIAGFICSFVSPLLGWVFGGVGLSRANKRNGKGKGFSIASIVIATIMFLLTLASY